MDRGLDWRGEVFNIPSGPRHAGAPSPIVGGGRPTLDHADRLTREGGPFTIGPMMRYGVTVARLTLDQLV